MEMRFIRQPGQARQHFSLAVLLLATLSASLATASPDAFRNPGQVLPPCGPSTTIDTTGWRDVIQTSSRDSRRFHFKMPSTFEPDSSVRFQHGGIAWRDLTRRIMWYNGGGDGCTLDEPGTVCAQCVDSLAGFAFELVSHYLYFDQVHRISAERYFDTASPFGWSEVLVGTSPDSSDQALLLTVIRSLQEEVRVATRGTLFIGGRQIHPPYAIKTANGRVVINGYYLPDALPSPALPSNANAELETRRAIELSLVATRDSLLRAGRPWDLVSAAMNRQVEGNPLIAEVRTDLREHSTERFVVVWKWGYQRLAIPEKTGAYTSGTGGSSWEETYAAMSARLDYIRAVLNAGDVLFLLGGGSEHVIPHPEREATLEGVQRAISGKSPSKRDEKLLPRPVRMQLRKPTDLAREN